MFKKLFFLGSIMAGAVLLGAGCVQFGNSAAANLGPVGMYRSADKGETWAPIAAFPTAGGVKSIAGVNVYRVFTDPGDVNALYLASRGQGLFYTFDRGDSWNWVKALSGKYIYSLVIDPQDKCVVYVSDESHIYKSIDCLRTWYLIYSGEISGQRPVSLAVDYADSKVITAALANGDILRSQDAGGSWLALKRFGFPVHYMIADPFFAKRLYVAAYDRGLLRSDDGGESWRDLSAGIANYSDGLKFYRLVLHPSKKNVLFWVSKYGILRSDDGGESWADLKLLTPPGGVNIYAFAISPKNDNEMYYVGTILGDKGQAVRSTFYKSVDGGNTWLTKKLPTNTVPVYLNVHPADTNIIYLGFTSQLQ